MHLKQLSISGFRGVGLHLELPLGHRTIIYGPNGSGKSSALQAIAWTIYGKLPFLTGTVFAREDALVNDFLSEARAKVALAFSDGSVIARTRDKQSSSGRGSNPISASFETEDPQSAIEILVDLSLGEFFAAIFLHQETIRDFITTTPEKRSATIDRMLGTYLLRTLIRVVDPTVPDKAIKEAEESIRLLDLHLSQAGVISREVIQKRKEEHGDATELPGLLEGIRQDLATDVAKVGVSAPEATMSSLEGTLGAARQAQLATVGALENQVGQFNALMERHEQAAVVGWRSVRQRREQYGDPADLAKLLEETQHDLTPTTEKLELSTPQATFIELEETLAAARRAQPRTIGRLDESIGRFRTLKERYEQAAVTSWQIVRQRREQYGDPAKLPHLLDEMQRDLLPITEKLKLQAPQATLVGLEKTLAMARRAQPTIIGMLRENAGQLSTLRERYEQTVKEVVEDVSVPPELKDRHSQVRTRIDAANRDLSALNSQLTRRQAIEQELAGLRRQVQALPELREESEKMQRNVDALEAAEKHGKLYNQIQSIGQDYLEQAQPEQVLCVGSELRTCKRYWRPCVGRCLQI
jgi:DNA repair exonuclease SbcCD ATPase subunit